MEVSDARSPNCFLFSFTARAIAKYNELMYRDSCECADNKNRVAERSKKFMNRKIMEAKHSNGIRFFVALIISIEFRFFQ